MRNVETILDIAYVVLGIFLGYSILQAIQYIVDTFYAMKSRLEGRHRVNSNETHTTKHVFY